MEGNKNLGGGGGGGGVVVVVVGVWGGRVEEKREFNGEGIWVIFHQNKNLLTDRRVKLH